MVYFYIKLKHLNSAAIVLYTYKIMKTMKITMNNIKYIQNHENSENTYKILKKLNTTMAL